ncbi:MAG: carbohydrate-binding protein [Bacteroidia bacterium]|nr:carbohydrate-binding protein [Bacteroidia bacterium]
MKKLTEIQFYARFLFLFLCVIPFNSEAQGFLSTKGKAIVNSNQDTVLLRGMGLGGWMLQEGYMLQTSDFANAQREIIAHITDLIGEEDTELFYEAWLSNHVTKTDIDSLKSWGFNMVRLPMHYNLYTLPIEEEAEAGKHTWLERGFELTDSLVEWCRQNEMYVMLDLHAAPGGQGYDEGISDYDPSKPSLWESKANRDKTVALWKRLAERYVDEEWIAGYDLINEPNWNMNGNIPLRDIYHELTDSIRSVDKNHIIFIEGNWFANDFTGLTPPWDDNLVYSPHKYWSINDKPSIQWVLEMRDRYDIPLLFGESGENSNVWFRDAIRLFEDEGIGWAWWPMKKIESISGPLSILKSDEYITLLDYWKGNGSRPTKEFAKAALMDLADKLKVENCVFQKDVIDAMFRQVYSTETKPYKTHTIPGVVYATDFDIGQIGYAYYDTESGNYNVSTGQYTSWNNGWSLRNDGVDIEPCDDIVNSNGYNVGWISNDEWMQYDVEVESPGVFDVTLRIASESGGGSIHFKVGDADITETFQVPSSGSWTNWVDMVAQDIVLDENDAKLRLYVDNGGFNLSSFEFTRKAATTSVSARLLSAKTFDDHTIQLDINKNLKEPLAIDAEFTVHVDGNTVKIKNYYLDPENNRIIYIQLEEAMRFDQSIQVSHNAGLIEANDETLLQSFVLEPVLNNLEMLHPIPGKIEAEDYIYQEGIQLETASDDGGGFNIGFLDPGDFLEYQVEVLNSADYILQYRVASEQSSGSCKLVFISQSGEEQEVDMSNFSSTGGWQNWVDSETEISLSEGIYTMRLEIINGPFNLNWLNFVSVAPPEPEFPSGVFIKSNPVSDQVTVTAGFSVPHKISWDLYNMLGQRMKSADIAYSKGIEFEVEMFDLPAGYYFLNIYLEDDTKYQFKLVKI